MPGLLPQGLAHPTSAPAFPAPPFRFNLSRVKASRWPGPPRVRAGTKAMQRAGRDCRPGGCLVKSAGTLPVSESAYLGLRQMLALVQRPFRC